MDIDFYFQLMKTPDHGHHDGMDHTPENCRGNIHEQLMKSITQAPRSTRKNTKTPRSEVSAVERLMQYSPRY